MDSRAVRAIAGIAVLAASAIACGGRTEPPPPSSPATGQPAATATPNQPAPAPAPTASAPAPADAMPIESCPPADPSQLEAYRKADAGATIPLVPGLTLSKVWTAADGDYETLTQVTSVDAQAVRVSATGPSLTGGKVTGTNHAERTICRADLESGHTYWTAFAPDNPPLVRGTTMFSMPAVYRELKTQVTAKFEFLSGARKVGSDQYVPRGRLAGELTRFKITTVPVIVNDQLVELPALNAFGTFGQHRVDLYVLDDAANPLTLDFNADEGDFRIKLTKISYPVEKRIETELRDRGRAEVYGIYFDFGSARLRPESEPVLQEIAGALARNPAWKLSVEGHTDNIGGDAYNQDLSARRAAAVKQALVDRHAIAAERLAPAGFGASRPKAGNETVEGRALNRRVELVRQ